MECNGGVGSEGSGVSGVGCFSELCVACRVSRDRTDRFKEAYVYVCCMWPNLHVRHVGCPPASSVLGCPLKYVSLVWLATYTVPSKYQVLGAWRLDGTV